MNVLIISQCTKNAAVETCRVLDQFAERCGDRTWQTHITQQGLDMLRTLLKRSARKNTAVACHWLRGRNRIELMWIVGNASAFNEKGMVPTNRTQRNILRSQDENDWHTLQDIQILAAIAALFHDFGKACLAFQTKLEKAKTNKKPIKDGYRHEWVSLRLFEAFVDKAKDDQSWLEKLATLNKDYDGITEQGCINTLIKDGIDEHPTDPFVEIPPLARAIGWLILTHHRLPQRKEDFNSNYLSHILNILGADYGYRQDDVEETTKNKCWEFKKRLPFSSSHWRAKASYWGGQALKRKHLIEIDWLRDNLFSTHLARLCLIFADHYYSRQPANKILGDANFPLYANTDRDGELKQRLDEHLIGVAKNTKHIIKILPLLERSLPRIARHKGFKQRTTESLFRWQNDAYDLACSLRDRSTTQGFFGINMASTGRGKTLANGRIMYGLSNPVRGARFSIALGLRVLTLQTGQAYRERLKLGDDDLAVLIGSSAVKQLFYAKSKNNNQQEKAVVYGSESSASLEPDNTYVHFDGSPEIGLLQKWLTEERNLNVKKLIAAPILVCTIDHLISATEGTRGGKQIVPMLRLLTSDLVLDEPDDFDIEDLPALTRLVHWAGMLGSRILLSSATLPPALVEGLFNAYKAGRAEFHKARGIPGVVTNICCAWFDENDSVASDHAEPISFSAAHHKFVTKRANKLLEAEVRRRAEIKSLPITAKDSQEIRQQLAAQIQGMVYELHQAHHTRDPETDKRVSFGLIRFANIDPLIDITKHFIQQDARENHQIRFCCYHSRHPLLIRDNIEKQLDNLLNRTDKKNSIFTKPELQNILATIPEQNIIFLVFASPVAEVGRDHDYDWAIVEPSSMRSIIQLAGRVKRHRAEICSTPNIYLLDTNVKSLENNNRGVTYHRPGFETANDHFLLENKNLQTLLSPEEYEVITSIPRITVRENLEPTKNLVDLEHARLQALMQGKYTEARDKLPVQLWWETQATLCAELQRKQRFRNDPFDQKRFALMYEEDERELKFFNIDGEDPVPVSKEIEIVALPKFGRGIQPWGNYDYEEMLWALAEQEDTALDTCAKRFGYVDLPQEKKEQTWDYNLILGLRREE